MSYEESEQEKLRRLRDQQIRARDPQIKERHISRRITSQQAKKRRNENFIKDSVKDVSHKAKGVYVGALVGLIVLLALPYFVEGKIATVIGIASIPFLMALGFLYGASFDWRDEIRDDIN